MGLTLIIKMQNDENTNVVEVETKDNEVESTVDETAEPVEESTNEEVDELAKAKAEAAKFRRLFEKSQAKPKAAPAVAPTQSSQASPLDMDERILKSQGMPNELLTQLKKVAAIEGLSLLDAQADPLFVAMKEKFEKEKRIKDASLGSSRGSGSAKARKSPSTPGLTREEHMAMFENRQ